jgi:ribosomal protein S18 acetylase RimI-like enzyme
LRECRVFCCRHALALDLGGHVAGMVLGYRLPVPGHAAAMLRRCASLRPDNWLERRPPSSYYLNSLALYPEYRKLGFGRLLLRAAEAQARRSSCSCMLLETTRGNGSALRFYRRNGFVPWSADGGGAPAPEQDTGPYLVLGKWLVSAVIR